MDPVSVAEERIGHRIGDGRLRLTQCSGVFFVQHSPKRPVRLVQEIEEAAVVPVIRVFPIRAVDHGVQTYTFDGHARTERGGDLLADLAYPPCTSTAKVTRFAEADWPLVSLIQPGEQLVERHPPLVARLVL